MSKSTTMNMNSEQPTPTTQASNLEDAISNRVSQMSASELSDAIHKRHKDFVANTEKELLDRKAEREAATLKAPLALRDAADATLAVIDAIPGFKRTGTHLAAEWTAHRDSNSAIEQIDNYTDQPTPEDHAIAESLAAHENGWKRMGGTALDAAYTRVNELKELPDSDPNDQMQAMFELNEAQDKLATNFRYGYDKVVNGSKPALDEEPTETIEETTETTDEPAPIVPTATTPVETTPAASKAPITIESETVGPNEGHLAFIARAIKKQLLEVEGETLESIQARHDGMATKMYARHDREFAPSVKAAKAAIADLDTSLENSSSAAKSATTELDNALGSATTSSAEDMGRYDIDIQAYRDQIAKNRKRAENRTEGRQKGVKALFSALRERASDGMNSLKSLSPSHIGRLVSTYEVEASEYRDIIEYSDGETSLLYQKDGYNIQLGPDSTNPRAKHLEYDSDDMAIIRTVSGKEYALVKGFLIDKNNEKIGKLPLDRTIDITIGKAIKQLPYIGKTDPIQSVILRNEKNIKGNVQVTSSTPFNFYMAKVEQELNSGS